MNEAATAYLSLGSNMGDCVWTMQEALEMIDQLEGTTVKKVSSFYQTRAWGITDQPDFVNAAAEISTKLPAEMLMNDLLDIENRLGRVRRERWGPRVIDIDLLLFDNLTLFSEKLHVPHPEFHKRKFVLVPLCEIAPEIIHPGFNKNILQLLGLCADETAIARLATIRVKS